jgi:hypothetical protein
MNSKHLKRIAIGFALGLSGFALAVTVPNYFVAGQAISSMSVNDNFAALKAAVDALEARKQAWVTVASDGSIYSHSTGVTWTVTKVATGHYCVSTSPSIISTVSPVVATLNNSGQPGMITFNNGWTDTCAPPAYAVYAWNGSGVATDSYFTLMVP